MQSHTVFITGAAGYVGAMLAALWATRPDVEKIICLDKDPRPEFLTGGKIIWISGVTAGTDWQSIVTAAEPDIVVNCAWQIREMYGNKAEQWRLNVEGSDAIFDFAFSMSSVRKLIHFSTVASYGAFPSNTIEHRFAENEPFRVSTYLYAEEKRIAEKHLEQKYATASNRPQVVVIRPAAITGPRGRFMRIRFGLQAALSGQLRESWSHKIVSLLVSFVPITKKWCRQFIHEDDVADILTLLAFSSLTAEYEVFNICPPGPVVTGKDMAKAVHKKPVMLPPALIRIAFFFFWHVSRGAIPTSRGGWLSYSYPIAVDGSKLTKRYGYHYKYPSLEAFQYTDGRYEYFVPEPLRVHQKSHSTDLPKVEK
jgi:nucleoside-diphosphate-sugar epimerase